jgi:hypothetical protein
MIKKTLTALLIAALIPLQAFSGDICSFDISDFAKIKQTNSVVSTSKDSFLGKLVRPVSGFDKNTQFFLKQNQLTWMIQELIAGSLYQAVLGKELIASLYLVCDRNDPQTFLLATIRRKGFAPFMREEGDPYFKDVYAAIPDEGVLPFSCVLGGCAYPYDKPKEGFEISVLASILLFESDLKHGNNFGLMKNNLSRFDFDGSFMFLDIFGVTQGTLEEGLNNLLVKHLSKKGISKKQIVDMMNGNAGTRVLKFLDVEIKDKFPSIKGKLNFQKLLNAGLEILSVEPQVLFSIIDETLKGLAGVINEKKWNKYYTIGDNYTFTSTVDPFTKTGGIAFGPFESEQKSATFPSVYEPILQAVKGLKEKGTIEEKEAEFQFADGRGVKGAYESVVVKFSPQQSHPERLGEIIKAHITYHYAALYMACKGWKADLEKGRKEL